MDALDVVTTEYIRVVDPIGNAERKEKAGKTLLARSGTQFFREQTTLDPFPLAAAMACGNKKELCASISPIILERYMREAGATCPS